MRSRTRSELRSVLERPLLRRLRLGPQVAGPDLDDALRTAAELVAGGSPVALDHAPARAADVPGELCGLVARLHASGLASACELTLPVGRLGAAGVRAVAEAAGDAGLAVVLAGPPAVVDLLAQVLPSAGVVVPAGERSAESRCRELAHRRVRLAAGHGAAADLSFVRCLNVLMSGSGRPAVAATDPRLIAITGERAAWNGRSPDSWEHVMPYRVHTGEQQRLAASGYTVRVAVRSGHPGGRA